MLVQTLMLFSTRHIFCSEILCESDHLQCCPNMWPFRGKRRTRGILINAVNVPAGGWWFHTPGLPAAVPQEHCQPLWGCVCGLGDRVHSAAHRPQRGLPVPGVRPRGRAAGVEPLERPPDRPHHAGPPRYWASWTLSCSSALLRGCSWVELCLCDGGCPWLWGVRVTCDELFLCPTIHSLLPWLRDTQWTFHRWLTASLAFESMWARRKALFFLLLPHNISIFDDLQLTRSFYLGERKT